MPKHVWRLIEVADNGIETVTGCPPIGPKPQIILPNSCTLEAFLQAPRKRQPLELANERDRVEALSLQPMVTTQPPAGQIHRSALSKPNSKEVSGPPPAVKRLGDAIYNPIIGGRMTIFVLMYGAYHDLHKQCLNSILSTTPPGQREIRIGCNEVCPETLQYLSRLKDQNHVQLVYVNPVNGKKYPMMRRMFWDPEHPIDTKWLLWFDDDSICSKDPEWYSKLASAIAQLSPEGYRMFGREYLWHYSNEQIGWVKRRPWYKGRMFQVASGREAPNGRAVKFATGGFWALETAAMRAAGIPDTELGHNGGDVCIGQQLWQTGFKVKNWNGQKQFVVESSVPRRGLNEKHPGQAGWQPGGA
jgi:hypothetical protein